MGNETASVDLSAGASVYPTNGTDFDTLLRAADSAMYRAKRAGKGRVVVATAEPPNADEAAAG